MIEIRLKVERKMKRIFKIGMTAVLAVLLLAGCGQAVKEKSEADFKQAGLGGLVMMYDDTIWTVDEEGATDASLLFEAGDNVMLGVSCSKEGLYQHPLDMLRMTEQIYSTFDGYEELSEPAEVEVNGQRWYEWSYRYEEDGTVFKSLQRFFAENYYAYTITYLADEGAFETDRQEALKAMNSVVMTVPDNVEAEKKAKEFLVGEWDLSDAGYLVLNEDGTYIWYMDSTKDDANMHSGSYGCDVENSSLGFTEGQGIYLVLFPEKLTMEGKESTTANAKYDYGISLDQQSDGSYQMLNVSTFNMYQLVKQ